MRLLRALRAAKKVSIDHEMNTRNQLMQGMDVASLRHHTALQPLFVFMAAGLVFVGAYVIRLGTKTTDISWTKRDPTVVNEVYADKQFQMLNPAGIDLSADRDRPDYRST